MKPKYNHDVRLYYMGTDGFIMHIKTKDFYKDISSYVEKWSDTSNYLTNMNRPVPKGKNKKEIGILKDELGGKTMRKLIGLRAKAYSHLMDDDSEAKKVKETKKGVTKEMLKFNDYKNCIMNNKLTLKS